MKHRRLLGILLALAILAGMIPVPARADTEPADPQEEVHVYTEEESAVLDEDVFARIREAVDVKKRGTASVMTEEDYVDLLPDVIAAVEGSETYVADTLQQNGNMLVWETTTGIPCCFDPYMEAKLNGGVREDEPLSDGLPAPVTEQETVSAAGLLETGTAGEWTEPEEEETVPAAMAGGNYPNSREIALIQPWWESKSDNRDDIFSSFGEDWKAKWERLCESVGSSKDHRYTMDNATVDNVAKAIEECGLVIVNSHGTTDYRGEDGDKTSRANCSYICLTTDAGITDKDTKKQTGPFGEYYNVMRASDYTSFSAACISNHMKKNAPNSFVYWGMCLGMATDRMSAPLRSRGVEAVMGFTQSVTVSGDYECMVRLMDALYDGYSLSEAAAYMKEVWGDWDPHKNAPTMISALEKRAAFTTVVSDEDAYPGHGNVDVPQKVKSTWNLYQPGGRTFLVASDIAGLQLTRTAVAPGVGLGVMARVEGEWTKLPTDRLSVVWEASADKQVTWKHIDGADDAPLVRPTEEMIGHWIRARISPKNQEGHDFTLVTAPVKVVTKMENQMTPVIPEITRDGSSPSFAPILHPRKGQEYLILTFPGEPTKEDWQNSWDYATEDPVDLSVGEAAFWGRMNYIWTRFKATDTFNAGSITRCTTFYYGSSSTDELKGTKLNITLAYNQGTDPDHEGFWAGDVLKIDVQPLPENVSFDGFAGSTWMYPLLYDKTYGIFYSDVGCKNEIVPGTKYKTVYLKLLTPTNNAGISCGTTSTKGCYTFIDVADSQGHFTVSKVSVPEFSVQIGEVTTGLPYTYSPEQSAYYANKLKTVRDRNGINGPEGTEPIVTFHADGTLEVNTVPCEEGQYNLLILDTLHGQVGRMRLWVGNFDAVPLEGLVFDEASVTCYAGGSRTLILRSFPENGTGVISWKSSNASQVSVKGPAQIAAGYVQAYISAGEKTPSGTTVLITASSGSLSATCKVKVLIPPVITSQPKDVSVNEGEQVTFTVNASGDELSYQWYYFEPDSTVRIPVEGAAGRKASLSFTAKAAQNGRRYSCWVSGGEAVSREAMLTVKKTKPDGLPFTDVPGKASYYDALVWAFGNGVVKGTDKTHFSPKEGCTRGQFCTMLWRMNGSPELTESMKKNNPFKDVTPGKGHGTAILWAFNNKIVTGMVNAKGEKVFNSGGKITRTNMIVMLFKMARRNYGSDAVATTLTKSPYKDIGDGNKNLVAYQWAYAYKVSRPSDGKFGPSQHCLRWQLVLFLYRYNNAYHVIE